VKNIVLFVSLLILFSCSETPNEVPLDSYREIAFNVDLNKIIDDGMFEVNVDTLKLILVSFDIIEMVDENDDNIYSVIISNMILGKTYEYKYAINESAEALDIMRVLTIQDNENNVLDYYGELNPTILLFHVDMSYQIELGNFNPDSDFLVITGILNNWDVGDLLNDSNNNDLYEITFSNLSVLDELVFKFRINENKWESPNPDVSDCIDDTYGGFNRIYTVEQGENIVEYCYNDECGN